MWWLCLPLSLKCLDYGSAKFLVLYKQDTSAWPSGSNCISSYGGRGRAFHTTSCIHKLFYPLSRVSPCIVYTRRWINLPIFWHASHQLIEPDPVQPRWFETESAIWAAQDQALSTGVMRARIWEYLSSALCRLCKEKHETVDKIVYGCKMLCGKIYLYHHTLICTYIHWAMLKDLGCTVPETWHYHNPDTSTTMGDTVITYDQSILTDRR